MTDQHLVVDGSNIATEGRTAPSLEQLNVAVTSFIEQHPFDNVVVVVDATFPNRITSAEVDEFEAAVLAGEVLTPPAGAVGRGDAFVLQIAEQTGATVLSNDSFQEFHGDHEWLFEPGRLWGGKPVPKVGWVFVERTPVRGPASRRSRQAAKKRTADQTASPEATEGGAGRTRRPANRRSKADSSSEGAPTKPQQDSTRKKSRGKATATATAAGPDPRRRAGSGQPINTPGAFLSFVSEHPLGTVVSGTVTEFASHGAYVNVGSTRCYIALKAMGTPPPRSPRDVLSIGDTLDFIVRSVDTPRRGIDLALTDGVPAVDTTSPPALTATGRRRSGGGNKQPSTQQGEPSEEETVATKKKAPAKRKAAAKKKAPAKRKAAAKKKAPARRR